jgi:hypothetical protein
MGIAIPAAQQATVFELLRLAPELDDARDLDDFVCTADQPHWRMDVSMERLNANFQRTIPGVQPK